ncbi:MAG: hypothetical protein U0841_10705 [Chloroflexia bacterium]
MSTIILIHGAWTGATWSRVAADLRARGQLVHTPTLTGLGERDHLLDPTSISNCTRPTSSTCSNTKTSSAPSSSATATAARSPSASPPSPPSCVGRLLFLDALLARPGTSLATTLGTAAETPPDARLRRRRHPRLRPRHRPPA